MADAHVIADRLRAAFASHGKAGAQFYVTSATHPDGPWTFTAGSRQSLTGEWALAAAGYDFSVHGPNGFFRRFAGRPGGVGADVVARHEDGLVCVEVVNTSAVAIRVTIADAYRGGRTASHRLRPGARVTHTADPRHSNGWYDVSVASDQDSQFVRRMAGHAETGRPSTSDPAIITA
ncbi:MAG: phospholipase [Cryptosporangiaceae bacterium]|nr:phospholipase [Cryptosporangiaceae bacterium]